VKPLLKFLLALLVATGAALAAAHGADDAAARRALAEKMMQQVGMEKMLDRMADQMTPTMGPMLEQALRARGVPEQIRKDFVARFPGNLAAEFKTPEVHAQFNEMVITMLATDYTAEELQQLSAFYATPLGQKLLAKQPAQFETMMGKGQQIGQTAGRRAAERTLREIGVTR
jgi:hypothetical protein